ncbi:Glycosyltransferase family 1 protein [Vibrio chagasii]|nr:Glycosyltransferase family 1 protein [Vibrio chagasii]CAH7324710.1 Glycosyltransferase family 1 protein [Vibrio chagasii]CAH7364113.1 Glycosyltransferase family 1 protein [Vibrio chagasii]CAH7412297.1 Glycosyltransferase family 1 protein [Vibrio chagasii]CAH7475952.1 Glycosyltransferase family 1 protein [Vibrio chagasii]
MSQICIVQNSLKTTWLFRAGYIEKAIKERKLSVVILAPNDCKNSKESLLALGADVKAIPFKLGLIGMLSSFLLINLYILRIRATTKDSKYICHFVSTYILTFLSLPNKANTTVYIEGLGSFANKSGFISKALSFALNFGRKNILCCNHSEVNTLALKRAFVTGGIGIDVEHFNRKALIKSCDEVTLLFVGRLISDKGILDAIEVYRRLNNNKVRFLVVGDIYPNNPTSLTSEDLATVRSEFQDKVSFVGYKHNMNDIYSKSDVLILPSKREGFPVCVMEASASGIPSIVYNVPGCQDAVKNDVNGFVVDYSDIDSMVGKVNQLIEEPGLLNKIKLSSVEYATTHFSRKLKDEKILEIIVNSN